MPLRIVPGTQIASKNVDGDKNYVEGRSIANLRTLGALHGATSETAERLDELVANQAPNGQAGIDAMVRAEQPAFQKTMFPEEKKLLPYLWRQLIWEDVPPAIAAPSLPAFDVLDKSIGAGADFTRPVKIADLPPELQRTASRVQLALDADGDASTIHVSDLAEVQKDLSTFSRSEASDIQKLVVAVKAVLRGDEKMVARVQVPAPGVVDVPIDNPTSVKLAVHIETRISETRTSTPQQRGLVGFQTNFTAVRSEAVSIEVPKGYQALLIHEATGEERLFGEGTHVEDNAPGKTIPAGTWRLELWTGGERVKSADVVVPEHGPKQYDLAPFVDYELVTSAAPLVRNLVAANSQASRVPPYAPIVSARWEYGETTVPSAVALESVATLATPGAGLPPGRYASTSAAQMAMVLDVYPEGVFALTVNNEVLRFVRPQQHVQNTPTILTSLPSTSGGRATFAVDTHHVAYTDRYNKPHAVYFTEDTQIA